MDIKCQIILAEKIDYDPAIKKHSIFNIINKILVPTIPAAVVTQVYFKYRFNPGIKLDNTICHMKIFDPNNESIYEAVLPELKNLRSSFMTPGIDGVVEVRIPVCMTGNYEYVIYAKDIKLCSYPLYIDLN
ncbi:hypothetical protein [Bacillus sp. SM2101]|uniref:hypothetical protein n=1 Tax=Bacillus sp. SM2101 TaxID=2805366 RepID=UPI001BDE180E|nr:hypothetical protein [Bacillus sp. SM2101]